jgi:hypothetical protein
MAMSERYVSAMASKCRRVLFRFVAASCLASLGALGASCGASSKPSLIVGTWELNFGGTGSHVSSPLPLESTQAERVQRMLKEFSVDEGLVRDAGGTTLTFLADGSGMLEGAVIDHCMSDSFTWRAIAASEDQMTVTMSRGSKSIESTVSLVFESPDVARSKGGKLENVQWRRVKK